MRPERLEWPISDKKSTCGHRGTRSCRWRHPETVKLREAPWSAAARRRLRIAPTEFRVRRALKGITDSSCNSAFRANSKAASSRRTPRRLRRKGFRSRDSQDCLADCGHPRESQVAALFAQNALSLRSVGAKRRSKRSEFIAFEKAMCCIFSRFLASFLVIIV